MSDPFCQKCGGTKAWIEELDKLLAMREVLKRLVSGYTVGDIGHLRNEGRGKAACEITVGDVLDIVDILNSTPADISRKYVKREVLEKCVEAMEDVSVARLWDLARQAYNGVGVIDAIYSREKLRMLTLQQSALTLARKELEK